MFCMGLPRRTDENYTYADYCTWDDGERWELIEGVPYAMSPAPFQRHQEICGEIFGQLREFLKGKHCKVFIAPFDVRLNADKEDDTVCQPDVLVVCDNARLDGKRCNGAPDLIVEVLSPSTARHDRVVKFRLSQQAGVREYWLIDPDTETVQVNILKDGQYYAQMYAETDTAPVSVLEGCNIDLSGVFAQ